MGNLFSSKNACTREAGGRYLTIIVQLFDEITKDFIISNITNLWANKFQFVKSQNNVLPSFTVRISKI